MKHKNNNWEILTPNGWKDFEGIEKTLVPKSRTLQIFLEDGNSIKCSGGHQLVVKRDNEICHLFADLIDPMCNDHILCKENTFVKVSSVVREVGVNIDDYDDMDEAVAMYDLINVDGGYEYYANDIVNHNCAHIADMDEIWVGLAPTLSCVAGDTLVLTDNGFQKIQDLHKDKNIGDYFDLKVPLYGKHGMEITSHGYVSPCHETLIVTTKHGHEIEVTPIHPLYTQLTDGCGKMIQAQNIKIGDHLRIECGMNQFGKTVLPNDVAYMLGRYTAERWTTSRDSKIECYSKEVAENFISLGIDPFAYCFEKEVPQSILQGSKTTVSNFLSGLFDGDGSATNGGLILSSTNHILLKQTQQLLLNFGIRSNIIKQREKNVGKRIMSQGTLLKSLRQSWTLTIPHSQCELFSKEIGFKIQHKQQKCQKISTLRNQNDFKLFQIPVVNIETKVKELVNRTKKSDFWFRQNHALRLDKCFDSHKEKRYVNQNWLTRFKTSIESVIELTKEDICFFEENLGTFFWDPVVSIQRSTNITYDFTVPNTHTFLQNCVLGSNTGGKAILISTPLGVGNTFHRIWVDAIEEKNDFIPIELPWTVHPERDQEWFERESAKTRAGRGERGVQQEYFCSFNASGDTFIKTDLLSIFEQSIIDPIAKHLEYPECWIWKYTEPGHKYLIAADVSRGNAADFSAFQVFNTTTDEIVCEYKGKVFPDELAKILIDVGYKYNTALICPELNTYGAHTASELKKANYPNLFYEKEHKNIYMAYMDNSTKSNDELPGWTSGPKSRDEAIAKLQSVFVQQTIRLPSKRLVNELKTFIWKNNKAQSMKGYNDDLIMALAIGVCLYENSGKQQYSSEEIAKGMLAGMSVGSSKFGTGIDDWGVRQSVSSPPIFFGGRGTGATSSPFTPIVKPTPFQSGKNQTQDHNQSFWRQWDWVSKD